MDLIAAELGAEAVRYSTWEQARVRTDRALQALLGDPGSDAEAVRLLLESDGFRACLILPVVSQGETLGLLKAWRREERPWSRAEISRGRTICFHLGSVLAGLADVSREPA